jgi:hypothetical protein
VLRAIEYAARSNMNVFVKTFAWLWWFILGAVTAGENASFE